MQNIRVLTPLLQHGYWETWNVLYGLMYCFKASEAIGSPLCIICVSIIPSLVFIFNVQMAAFPNRLRFHSAPYWNKLLCCSSGRSTLSLLKELEQHNNLFHMARWQVNSIGEKQPSEHSKSWRGKMLLLRRWRTKVGLTLLMLYNNTLPHVTHSTFPNTHVLKLVLVPLK